MVVCHKDLAERALKSAPDAKLVTITVSGRGFLYNMVRIIAGTLIDVGRGNRDPEDVPKMLQAKCRQAAGPTAPANGLTLTDYRFLDAPPWDFDRHPAL